MRLAVIVVPRPFDGTDASGFVTFSADGRDLHIVKRPNITYKHRAIVADMYVCAVVANNRG